VPSWVESYGVQYSMRRHCRMMWGIKSIPRWSESRMARERDGMPCSAAERGSNSELA